MAKSRLNEILHSYFPFGFHLSRRSWDWLDIRSLIEATDVSGAAADIYTIRRLAERFNQKYFYSFHLAEYIKEGQLISIGLIVDILRYLVHVYCHEQNPGILPRGLNWTAVQRGRATVEQTPPAFVHLFPPVDVIMDRQKEDVYLKASFGTPSAEESVSREMMLLHMMSINPAFRPFRELFNDADLKKHTPYALLIEGLERFFDNQPVFNPIGKTLFKCLRAPMESSPDSLEGQLYYIKDHWSSFLPPELLERLLLATDILREETMLRGFGSGPNLVLEFSKEAYLYAEPARFSKDADWMSNVVLIAKSVYVWLDQLSKKYQRHIRYLSDIPDEELDQLARWGFTGLWLIGLWERSRASQTIKQIMGNPEAAPSAYSVYDYVIAEGLGGEAALENLRERAWQRGIRLASDMVPNHMGIYSKWVIEHPDWFLQLNYPPYPCYQFTGVDLSDNQRVCIQIEDGYWQHRDAAVVFKRTDKWTGDVKYIYHGNDGTNMPWNDTAQLNFTLPYLREAVIQMILHVAHNFPIIRFDAAMTLAKKHYQRLWFPQHGHGGAIPSRAEHGMSRDEFDKVFPTEFWREVVDRIAAEAPDTLLLAEAFWLMEGYFVRTLGMHRVYNSAFMNMLKMEDNCKYRMTVKNVLEFSPEVLKRFVNFMNNPDEATAVEQFGKGDKYFGVAVLMVTMPGLPMFGHGQIEGFAEKYGMEYYRAYWNEQVDEEMVRRHETQIFPLMHRRYLFSGAENFAFYDFNTPKGWVDENVFAYSNRAYGDRAIILYNNAYNTTRGWIHTSTPINISQGEETYLVRKTLAEALALNTGEHYYYAFRDYQSGLEYIRGGRQIAKEGLHAVLHAYQYQAFLDFREIYDTDGSWMELARKLDGNGVANLDEAYKEMVLEPVLIPFRAVLNANMLRAIAANNREARSLFHKAMSAFLVAVKDFAGADERLEEILQDALSEFDVIPLEAGGKVANLGDELSSEFLSQITGEWNKSFLHIAVAWITVRHIGRLHPAGDTTDPRILGNARAEEWLLRKAIAKAFQNFSGDAVSAYFDARLVTILMLHKDLLLPSSEAAIAETIRGVLQEPLAREYLQVNRHDDVLWLNKEQLEKMIKSLLYVTAVRLEAKGDSSGGALTQALQTAHNILAAANHAGYRVEKTIRLLSIKCPCGRLRREPDNRTARNPGAC